MTDNRLETLQAEKARFGFGRNWARYLKLMDDERIYAAEQNLKNMLERESLEGLHFLDVGSGSGLFSLAARNLGATVHSFDYDRESVGCTRALREDRRPGDEDWIVEWGNALDEEYLGQLGTFDVVYSWGVLHHTGDMWRALGNMVPLVNNRGQLFVALYNDQRWLSKYWICIKQLYNTGLLGRVAVVGVHAPYFLARLAVKQIFRPTSRKRRGMDPWCDILDWLGGYPFEVARPESVLDFYRKFHFTLELMTTVDGRHGCNEYVLRANSSASD